MAPKKPSKAKTNGKGKSPSQKKPNGKRLTLKQRRFVQAYTDPKGEGFGNATKAAELSGYEGDSGSTQLSVQGHHNLRKPKIEREIENALIAGGVTPEVKTRVLREAMDANIVKVFCPKDGELVYADPLVDHQSRLKAVELAGRITGDFLPNQVIERRETLIQQQNILIVPPQQADNPSQDTGPVIRQLED